MKIFNPLISIPLLILCWNQRVGSWNIENGIKINSRKEIQPIDGVFEDDDNGNSKKYHTNKGQIY